jgi:hypothetical protein
METFGLVSHIHTHICAQVPAASHAGFCCVCQAVAGCVVWLLCALVVGVATACCNCRDPLELAVEFCFPVIMLMVCINARLALSTCA